MSKTEISKTLSKAASFNKDAALVYLMAPGLNGREGIPACLWGIPGGGKSTEIRALCQSLGFHVETVILSTREPSEVCGTPIPQRLENGEVVIVYAKPLWARNVEKKVAAGIPCVVFFDEISTCAPSTQAPALRLVNEGNAADWSVHPSVRFFAAANPPECSAGGQELTPPMANRMGHFTAPPVNGKSFSEWLQRNGGDRHHLNYVNSAKEQEEGLARYQALKDKLANSWSQEFAKARALVGQFAERHEDAIHKMPDPDHIDAGRAWASPRTWEAEARLLATCRCLGMDSATTTQVMVAMVGDAGATEFLQYANSFDLPDLYDLLNGRSAFEVNPAAADVAVVVMNGLANLASALNASGKLSPKQRKNFWKFIGTGAAGRIKDAQMRVLGRVIDLGNTLYDGTIPECVDCLTRLGAISEAIAKNKKKS